MKKASKILAGIMLATVLTTSVALAAVPTSETLYPQGPIYKIIDRLLEKRIGMGVEEVVVNLKARTLKSTLEANGVDVEALQTEILDRVSQVLARADVHLNITQLEENGLAQGVKISFTQENPTDKFLLRGMLLDARANYFNLTHAGQVQFTLEGGSDDNSIYMIIKGNNPEIANEIQYRFSEYSS